MDDTQKNLIGKFYHVPDMLSDLIAYRSNTNSTCKLRSDTFLDNEKYRYISLFNTLFLEYPIFLFVFYEANIWFLWQSRHYPINDIKPISNALDAMLDDNINIHYLFENCCNGTVHNLNHIEYIVSNINNIKYDLTYDDFINYKILNSI